ncbi:MAG: hypothetical protein JWN40_2214, partial [Phycisphaerales bacterium]|nr:hypothetical protein [Phycisphaerales bacterium]
WFYSPMKYHVVFKAPLMLLLLLPVAGFSLGTLIVGLWLLLWVLVLGSGIYETNYEVCADRHALERMRSRQIPADLLKRVQRFFRAAFTAAHAQFMKGHGGALSRARWKTRVRFVDGFIDSCERAVRTTGIVPSAFIIDLFLLPAFWTIGKSASGISVYFIVTLAVLVVAFHRLYHLYLGCLIGVTMRVHSAVQAHSSGVFSCDPRGAMAAYL